VKKSFRYEARQKLVLIHLVDFRVHLAKEDRRKSRAYSELRPPLRPFKIPKEVSLPMAASSQSMANIAVSPESHVGFYQKLNAKWHERALQAFMAIVLAHWGEHLVQAYQIYVMGWPRPKANGILGLWYPWLIKSETLHYGYALVMLIGLWILRKGFTGRSYTWWMIAFWIQFWHHIEHFLLITQATIHHNFWGKPVPFSVLQLVFPRVELHLFYNSIVFIPMVIAMYYHMFPPLGEAQHAACSCSWRKDDEVEPGAACTA
jgi:hypothetical protein